MVKPEQKLVFILLQGGGRLWYLHALRMKAVLFFGPWTQTGPVQPCGRNRR